MRGALVICHPCDGTCPGRCKKRGYYRESGDGEESDPPATLPDDPAEALRHLASFIAAARIDRGRMIREQGYRVGYWQTDEWTEGLHDLGAEAMRVAAIAARQKEGSIERLNHLNAILDEVDPIPTHGPIWPFYAGLFIAILIYLTYCIYVRH